MKKNRTPASSLCHRIGFGFDSHLFSSSGTLVLGGVLFPFVPRLKGHSDGDALIHAVIDAVLGAAGLGDIGDTFPDTDSRWRGASGVKMLAAVLKKLKPHRLAAVQVDVTVLADRPRLKNKKMAIRRKLSRLMGIPLSQFSVKAKTQEGLTLFKEPGGVAVWATALLEAL